MEPEIYYCSCGSMFKYNKYYVKKHKETKIHKNYMRYNTYYKINYERYRKRIGEFSENDISDNNLSNTDI